MSFVFYKECSFASPEQNKERSFDFDKEGALLQKRNESKRGVLT